MCVCVCLIIMNELSYEVNVHIQKLSGLPNVTK